MAAGDFTASELLDIKLKAEEMWADSRLAQDFKANAEAAVAVKQHSSARFTEFNDREHDRTVIVTWLNPCAVAVEDCESNCDITEPQLETSSMEVVPTLCKKTGFSVDQETTRTNAYTVEEQAARGLAQSIKVLDEWWAQQVIIKLKAFEGINVDADPYTYAAGTTTVPAANWNADLIPDIMYDAILNKMGSGTYYLNNGNLWTAWTRAQFNAGNADGAGDAAKIKALPWYFDPFNFGPAGVTEDVFAISPSALAYVTTNRNPDQPKELGGDINQTIYTVNSSVIPGVKYDVYYKLKCITGANGSTRYVHAWRVQTQGDIFHNPNGCPVIVSAQTYNPTGIISYSKGA